MMKMISIDSFTIPMERVSIPLQQQYLDAERAVAAAPAGPIRNAAKAKLNEVAKQILVEQTPHLVLKASPKFAGSRGFYEAINKRTA